MNILVTGGSGQLGASIRKISTNHPEHHFIFSDIPELDITDRNSLSKQVENHRIDAIINCAAYTAVDQAEKEPELAAKINTTGARILGETALEYGIKLIHISTDYVFDGEACHPLHEDHPVNPCGIYGKTKLAGEQAIRETGCDAVVIRTAWLYSEFGNNFVKTMLRLGKERDSLNVVYDQLGTPTYAPDLAEAAVRLAENEFSGFDLFHYSNEGAISWYDFAHAIFDLAGLEVALGAIESHQYPTPAKRPSYSVLSKDKIKSQGISVPYWKKSLQVCLAELKKQQKN